jgi:DNA-3-methyladenine glycosylase
VASVTLQTSHPPIERFPEVQPLPAPFFDRPTLEVTPELLGKYLVHEHPSGVRLVGRIVEVEAYTQDDPAFHGWGIVDLGTGLVKPDGRGYDLFAKPGRAYIYLCYGTYWLLNVVTEREGVGGAILIRAVEPIAGIDSMYERREAARRESDLASGPGKLAMAFDIDGSHHRTDLTEPPLYFAEGEDDDFEIATSSRIGITRAVDRQWRFYIKDNRHVSPGVPSDIRLARRSQVGR